MASQDYPAQLSIDFQDRLGRASTIFRIILIIPIAILLNILVAGTSSTTVVYDRAGDVVSRTTSWGTGIVGTLFLVTLLMILFRKRYPRWWFDFNLALHRFIVRVSAYLFLLTDKYPSTEDEQNIHLELRYPDAQTELMRGMPLVKWLLAIPHYIVLFFLWIAAYFVVIIGWFAIIFTGRFPQGLFNFVTGVMRWTWRVQSYAFILATDKYPPFSLD